MYPHEHWPKTETTRENRSLSHHSLSSLEPTPFLLQRHLVSDRLASPFLTPPGGCCLHGPAAMLGAPPWCPLGSSKVHSAFSFPLGPPNAAQCTSWSVRVCACISSKVAGSKGTAFQSFKPPVGCTDFSTRGAAFFNLCPFNLENQSPSLQL